jgi:ribosomal protein L33
MKITRDWLIENTNHGAPTRAQLAVLGVAWPPPSGWMRELVGMEISDTQAQHYIANQNVRAKKKDFPSPQPQEVKREWKFCPHCGKSLER